MFVIAIDMIGSDILGSKFYHFLILLISPLYCSTSSCIVMPLFIEGVWIGVMSLHKYSLSLRESMFQGFEVCMMKYSWTVMLVCLLGYFCSGFITSSILSPSLWNYNKCAEIKWTNRFNTVWIWKIFCFCFSILWHVCRL